ncbi:hypothetical protein AXF42_Ash004572 [Apostasia shenzhenica]|uniref:Uncharacterized protein n=1 Tax=Apostasia shenzhenica TaxID=1088818 RepID=A0A2I0BH09_9ASPA|nr:hypothetical protein AXF42_Ash004572 [Apostasia shenzhenica]
MTWSSRRRAATSDGWRRPIRTAPKTMMRAGSTGSLRSSLPAAMRSSGWRRRNRTGGMKKCWQEAFDQLELIN